MDGIFANVHGFADADLEMDIDANFHEGEAIFFDKLGYTKRDQDAEDEPEEEKKTKDDTSTEETKQSALESGKPVTFLERPLEVRNAQAEAFGNYSDDEEDEDKILDNLFEDTKEKP